LHLIQLSLYVKQKERARTEKVCPTTADAGHAAALCYKPEGRGFDSRWCHWNCPLT